MEVAKYIGLFLLKNKTCYIHGLGNLELKRKPAMYDGSALLAPSYEVNVVPVGTVDESLANFIATNEQISISKASAALKDFSTQTKAQIAAGRYVTIPSIGKFAETNGKLQFITDPHLQYALPAIAIQRSPARRVDNTAAKPIVQTPSPAAPAMPSYTPTAEPEEETEGVRLNWGRILLVGIILAATIALAVFGYRYMKGKRGAIPAADTTTLQTTVQPQYTPPVVADTVQTDTSLIDDGEPATGTTPATINKGPLVNFRVILNVYDERPKAEKRLQRLRSYGNKVDMIAEDSTTFFIVMPVSASSSDTSRILDSLQRNFNPDGVSIY